MRKLFLTALTCIALLPCVATYGTQLGGYATYWDGDDLGDGWGAGGRLVLPVIPEVLGLDLRGAWVTFDDVKTDIIPVEAAALLNIPVGPLSAYGGVGVGYYFIEPDEGDADDNVGFFPLAGATLGLGDAISLFGEVRWLFLDSDVDAALQTAENLDDNVDIDGLGVNFGVLLGW